MQHIALSSWLKHLLLIIDFFLQCFPFIFFKPSKHDLLSFPTPKLLAETKQRLSKGYLHSVKSMGVRGLRILYRAISRHCCPFKTLCMNRAWFLQGKLPCVKQSSDALAATSLSKGEMGKVDKFRFFTPLLRCSFSCCHMFSNDSSVEKNFFFTKDQERDGLSTHQTVEIIGNQYTGWDGQHVENSLCSPQYRREKSKEKKLIVPATALF